METSGNNLVSVIVPVYNGARFIIEALASVRAQTYPHWECIVVDDGSTDETASLVQEWISRDRRFRLIRQANKGLSGARNTGLDHSIGSLIQFLDGDDILLPSKLERQERHFRQGDHSGRSIISYTDYSAGSSGDITRPFDFYRSSRFNTGEYLNELIARWESSLVIPPHCFLFSAAFFREKKIRFDTALPNHEDFDCWMNIFRLQPEIKYLDEKLCIYRITDNSMSKKMKLMSEGFLQVLHNQMLALKDFPVLKNLLIKKRREVLKRYNRIDIMTFKEKIILSGYISGYYSRRILQKAGFPT